MPVTNELLFSDCCHHFNIQDRYLKANTPYALYVGISTLMVSLLQEIKMAFENLFHREELHLL